ncbi:Carboxylic ester hydrolase [Fusarium sp. LHS14.1]|nr:Carboxylic ester hydrolase [Fusarium sp. LHS14.1]
MYCSFGALGAVTLAFVLPGVVAAQNSSDPLPVLDFGYALHRAADFNETGGYYNFSNIRYAAPPLGDLRFRAPEPPAIDRSVIQDGSESRICPQNYPPWMATIGWVPEYLLSGTVPNTTAEARPSTNTSSTPPRDPSQDGDCLFLDVVVSQEAFKKAGQGYGAPVLVWIYGGGYAIGSKTSGYDPRTYGGREPAPFQQAIIQSPAWTPIAATYTQEQRFQDFLRFANVSSLAEARGLPTDQLMDANDRQIFASPYGSYGFGPSVDGVFVTQDPKAALAQGHFDASVRIMVGQNSNEGLLFTPPITDDAQYLDFVRSNFPTARDDAIDHITNTLYPPIFDGSRGYRDQVGRAALTMGEGTFVCNAYALDRAYGNRSSYLFDVFPGLHAQDVEHTFYKPDVVYQGLPVLTMWGDNQTIAYVMQDYFTSFAIQGIPESQEDGLSDVLTYGDDVTLTVLSKDGIVTRRDPAANERCAWWQTVLID